MRQLLIAGGILCVLAAAPLRAQESVDLLLHNGKIFTADQLLSTFSAVAVRDDRIVALGFPILQLHGSESPERVAEVKARTRLEIWKAVGIDDSDDLKRAEAYTAADRLLVDAKPPKGADRTGGHGLSFDWNLLKGWQRPAPWILAGGLTPDNVSDAVRLTGAPAVDVSSGVERVRGLKDRVLVKTFIDASKNS